MKKLFITTIIASAIASTAFSQGFVNFSGGGSASTRVSTNSAVGGALTGATLGANNYYYALFVSASQTATAGYGNAVSYVFNNMGGGTPSTGWELVGIGASAASAGRFSAISQGTTSAGQGALNADNSFTVQGVGGAAAANFVAVGWSANIGSTLAAVEAWYGANGANVAMPGWIGQSTTATQTLGDGGLVITPSWNTAPSFGLGLVATPEPGTLALAALGGASLLLFRRKK
jgi:hypothetical protein